MGNVKIEGFSNSPNIEAVVEGRFACFPDVHDSTFLAVNQIMSLGF